MNDSGNDVMQRLQAELSRVLGGDATAGPATLPDIGGPITGGPAGLVALLETLPDGAGVEALMRALRHGE